MLVTGFFLLMAAGCLTIVCCHVWLGRETHWKPWAFDGWWIVPPSMVEHRNRIRLYTVLMLISLGLAALSHANVFP